MPDSLRETQHAPDRLRLPKTLQSLDWKLREDSDLFNDGDQVLVAVPVNDRHRPGEWYYEISVVSISCDEDFFSAELHGESWGWEMSDVEWYVNLG